MGQRRVGPDELRIELERAIAAEIPLGLRTDFVVLGMGLVGVVGLIEHRMGTPVSRRVMDPLIDALAWIMESDNQLNRVIGCAVGSNMDKERIEGSKWELRPVVMKRSVAWPVG